MEIFGIKNNYKELDIGPYVAHVLFDVITNI